MKVKLLTGLLAGSVGYLISVLIGLLTGNNLNYVLFAGCKALILFAAGGWLTVYLMEIYGQHIARYKAVKKNNEKQKKSDKIQKEEEASEIEEKDDRTDLDSDDSNFTPLKPPVLESVTEED